jgi:hypothetical protein
MLSIFFADSLTGLNKVRQNADGNDIDFGEYSLLTISDIICVDFPVLMVLMVLKLEMVI